MKKENILNPLGKSPKTINFDKIVLEKLEQRAKKADTSVSNIVNFMIRQQIMNDVNYYRQLQKYHYLKMQEYNFMKEQCEIQVEVRD